MQKPFSRDYGSFWLNFLAYFLIVPKNNENKRGEVNPYLFY
jgi:hypothetical protein